MPLKSGNMNRQERAFSEVFARTGDATFSAAKAGYSSPAKRAHQNLQKPAIQAEIIKHQQQILVGELLPASTVVLAAMLNLETAGVPWSARAQAAKIVRSEVAGMADNKGAKDFSDMTADEIHQAIEDARRQLAERSKPIVDATPASAEESAFE
jgi:phage terminase small subunit